MLQRGCQSQRSAQRPQLQVKGSSVGREKGPWRTENLTFSSQGAPGGFPHPASPLTAAKMQMKAHIQSPAVPSLGVWIQQGHLRDGDCCVLVATSLSGTQGVAKSWLSGIPWTFPWVTMPRSWGTGQISHAWPWGSSCPNPLALTMEALNKLSRGCSFLCEGSSEVAKTELFTREMQEASLQLNEAMSVGDSAVPGGLWPRAPSLRDTALGHAVLG